MHTDSSTARLWGLLRDRPDHYTVAELAQELRTSKAQVWRSLYWLEERGLVSIQNEED